MTYRTDSKSLAYSSGFIHRFDDGLPPLCFSVLQNIFAKSAKRPLGDGFALLLLNIRILYIGLYVLRSL